MKSTIKFILSVLILVLALQFSSACVSTNHNNYNDLSTNDGIILIIQQVPADNYNNHEVENEDRYPVYDYRNGYSYRATYEYQEDLHEEVYSDYYNDYKSNYNYHDSERVYYQQTPYIYYSNDDYMRTYTPHECYVNPPHDRVFYIKCP